MSSMFTATVWVECDTAEQAHTVLAERLQHDEDYGFEYKLGTLGDLREEL